MPRRSRHGHAKAAQVEPVSEEFQRRERAKVFERTKMCKFHILGCCSRGAACHFAHTKEELMSQPDLARTKLCKTLISTGQCSDPDCRYAHSKEELRLVTGFNCSNGRSNSTSPAPSPGLASSAVGHSMPPKDCLLPPAALSAAMMGEEGCMLQPMLQQAAMQLENGAFQPALQQVALQQLAEAAQAHAAEAMRLKAMAACLQGSGFPTQFAVAPYGGLAQGYHGVPYPMAAQPGVPAASPGQGQKSGGGGKGEELSRLKGRGGPERPERGGLFRPAPEVAPASGGLYASSYAGPEVGLTPAPPDTYTPCEPAQINPLSLRSLSSCSLADMAKTASGEEPEEAEASGWGWTVKNTFLDLDSTSSPAPGRLRTICSAAGRLDSLAEASPSSSPALGPRKDPSGLAPPPPLACGEHTPLQAPQWGLAQSTSEEQEASGSASSPLAPGVAAFVDPAVARGITVKNTFLDFAVPERATLRAVQTAAGRLDLLVDDDDDDF